MSTEPPDHQDGLGRSGDPERPNFTGPEQPTAHPRPWPDVPPRPDDPPRGNGSSAAPSPGAVPPAGRPRPRRRGRGLAVLVVVLVLVLAALVVGDRVGVHVAERRLGTMLQSQLNTPTAPVVTIPDVPFLTQAATGHFGEVQIAATDIPPADKSLALLRLDLNLHDVRASNGYRTLQVATVDGTARFDYAALTSSVGSTVTYAGKDSSGRDRVQVKISTTLVNQTLSATLTGPLTLDVSAQTVTLADPEIDLAGVQLPAGVSNQLAKLFVQPVSISGLPLGVRLSSLTAGPDGLEAGLAGENVTITRR